ncbi:MAG: hypothetical protein MI741_00715 [Rhodospirillales bacterium]|nr:hypothetical protein [Rhodospirillales bacterium]
MEEQRIEFSRRRLIATPIAGAIAWSIVGISSFFLEPYNASIVLFIATGMIVYLAMFVSKLTGENFLAKDRPKNTFDILFFVSIGMSVLIYAIAIPFFLIDYTSLPLTVGILTGTMWLPISWIIKHWIGLAHGIARTIAVLGIWYAFPDHRFLAVPLVIAVLYAFAITVLELRWRSVNQG